MGFIFFNRRAQRLLGLFLLATVTSAQAGVPRFAYVTNPYDHTISGYFLDAESRMFFNGMVYTGDKFPAALIIHPNGKFIYSASRTVDTALIYKIDPRTGWLTETPGPRLPTRLRSPFSYGFHPSGKFLYVAGRGGGVAAFTVDEASGALGYVPGSPYKAGDRTRSLTVHPSGKFVYASNAYTNNISAYRVNQSTGVLTELPDSPFFAGEAGPFASTIAMLPDATDNKGGIPYYTAAHPSGKFVYVVNWMAASVSIFRVDETSGDLSLIGKPTATGDAPYAVAVHPSGNYVLVSTWGGHDIYVYTVNLQTGELEPVPGSPFGTLGFKPVDIKFNSDGSLVFVANKDSNNVSIFDMNVTTGKLALKDFAMTRAGALDAELVTVEQPVTLLPHYAFVLDQVSESLISYRIDIATGDFKEAARAKTGKQPVAVAQDPLNRFVYVANAGSNNVSAFAIDSASGALTEVEGSPYAVGENPRSIAVDANGWYLYTLNHGSQDMSVFLIHVKKGQLAEAQGSPVPIKKQLLNLATDPTSRFVYINSRDGKSVSVYRYRQAVTPSIFEISEHGSPFVFDTVPNDLVVDPTGRFALVLQGEAQQVSMFNVHVATGALEPIKENLQPYKIAGKHAVQAAFHPSGKFAYVLNAGSKDIVQLKLDRLNGKVSEIDKPAAIQGKPLAFTIDPSGQYLYVLNEKEKGLGKYRIDKTTGKLTRLGEVMLPYSPAALVISREFQ
ncbi:MAG TPA: beta-propeller fold lactonase family protein [Gammaproteobacteria bacterium]